MFAHSKPSDLYLFLLWGIEQYVCLSRDFEFLEEFIPFYNEPQDIKIKISERIKLLINYVFSQEVGFGEHGLIKCNDGDWSDGISLMVKSRRKFLKHGESSFNSSFALYIIPRVLKLIKTPKKHFIDACLKQIELLKQSIFKSYNGKWFYRGWDGIGNPIGDSTLHLEHHTWLLISKVLDNEKALELINQIYNILDKPSPIGQYISYPPVKTYLKVLPKGWDVNGGIWHAINALLTWAYSLYDKQKAFNSLIKNSLAYRAEHYPNIWYGIWSAPDSYIADYSENAGEAFYHFATPMCDFPIMNLNAHATYLLSVAKIVGIEADNNGLEINPKLENQEFIFKSPLISIESYLNKFNVYYNVKALEGYYIRIKTPNWWSQQSRIYLNKMPYKEEYDIKNGFINITIPANFGTITLELNNNNL
jgi:cellobiose phosphorylase